MKLLRYICLLLLGLTLIIPLSAQEISLRALDYGETVGDIFALDETVPHEWQFQAQANDRVQLNVRRIGGIFTPRLELIAPDGSMIPPTTNEMDAFGQVLMFEDGLGIGGTYRIFVTQSDASSDGILTQSEYSLTLTQNGQVLSDRNDGLDPIPSIDTEAIPDNFIGTPDTESFTDIELYGDIEVSRIDPNQQRNGFLLEGARSINVDNTNIISRIVNRIAISDDGITVETRSGNTFFTDKNISTLSIDGSILEVELDDGTNFRTDFYAIESVIAVDEFLAVQLLSGQRLIFDGRRIEITRRGGINGEGPNVEPIVILEVDGSTIETDLAGWDILTVLDDSLRVLYGDELRLISDNITSTLFQRNDVESTIFDINIASNASRRLALSIDPHGMGDVVISNDVIAIRPLDGRNIVDEFLNLEAIEIQNQVIRLAKADDSFTTILPDETRIITPDEIPIDVDALPTAEGHRPRNFNNLGTTVSDYHPQVDMSFALDPVNRVIGNFVYPVQEYHVPSQGLSLDWGRTYNSMAGANQTPRYMQGSRYLFGQVGNQWRHQYQIELDTQFAPLGELQLILADGSAHIFTATDATQTVYRSQTLLSWVIEQTDGFSGDWIAYRTDGSRYLFDVAGRLQRITHVDGQVLLFSPIPRQYLENQNAQSGFFVTEGYGRRIEVYTNADNQVFLVRDAQGRSITYNYDDNLLVSVTYFGENYSANYTYRDGLLTSIDDVNSPYQQQMELRYNDAQQVVEYMPNSSLSNATIYSLSYDERSTNETWLFNDESQESSWEYDSSFHLTAWNLPLNNWVYRWRYLPDTGMLSEIVQPNRAVLRFNYDQFGYLTRFTDPLFGSTFGTYDYTYQTRGQYQHLLQSVSTPQVQSWLTFEYDAQNRLSNVVQAISGTIEERQSLTTQYQYDALNRIAQIIEPSASDMPRVTAFFYDDFGYANRIEVGSQSDLETGNVAQRWDIIHDGLGRLLSVTDDRDLTTSIRWDTDREIIASITVDEAVYSYEYDMRDNLIMLTAPHITETYEYDSANRLLNRTDSLNRSTSYAYDEIGNLLSITRPDGINIDYSYDALGNLMREVLDGGIETRYDVALNIESNRTIYTITNPSGSNTQFQYDPLGRLRQVSDFDRDGNATYSYTFSYNPRGNLTEIVDNSGRTLTASYDFRGLPLITTINGTASTNYTYSNDGLLTTLTDSAGRITQYSYDILGNPSQVILPDATQQTYSYDSANNLIRFTDANENDTTFTYDNLSRLTSTRDANNNLTSYEYNLAGNLTASIDARSEGNRTVYRYDEVQHLIEWQDPLGNITRYNYDVLDNLVRIIAPNDLQTDITYDVTNNVSAVTQPNDREILYGRDLEGRIISETNPLGQTTVFAYNTIDEIGRITTPLGNVQSFSWFGSGRIARYNLSDSVGYEYFYDELGRLEGIIDLSMSENSTENIRFEYDAVGNIVTIRQGNSMNVNSEIATVSNYTYDAMGRVISYLPPDAENPYQYQYDALGNLISVIDAVGVETQYTYDNLGNIAQIIQAVGTPSETVEFFGYDAVGNLTASISPEGIRRNYTYDSDNRLTFFTELAPNEPERTFAFEYNSLGRVSRIFDPNGLATIYRYDLFGNLVAIEQNRTIDGEEQTIITRYSYDEIDNLSAIQLPAGQSINLSYNGSGQRVRYVDALNNTWSFSYDDTGHIEQISDPLGNVQSFQYDVENRLNQITFEEGAQTNFTYDSNGNLSSVLLPITDSTSSREEINYSLDIVGHLLSYAHDDDVTLLERDRQNRIASVVTALNTRIDISYDDFDRLISATSPEYEMTRSYDSAGRLSRISGTGGTFSFDYDGYGNISQMRSSDVSIAYNYDLLGNIVSRDASQFGSMRYSYDELYRPIRIDIGDQWVEIQYNDNSWRTNILRSNGIETRYTYDANGRVRNVTHLDASAETQRIDGFAYEYDATGNVIRVTRADNWAILYSYDDARQLISERWLDESNQITYSVNYTYDDAGNRIEQTQRIGRGNQTRTIFEYNSQNQLIAEYQDAPFDIEDRFSLPLIFAMVFALPFGWFVRRRPRYLPVMLAIVPFTVPLFQTTPTLEPTLLYEYDVNGNLNRETYQDGNEIEYQYDDLNRLVAVFGSTPIPDSEEINTINTRIRYNSLGEVLDVTENDTAYEFIYDAYGLVGIRAIGSDIEQTYYSPVPNETMLISTSDGDFWTLDDGLGHIQYFAEQSGDLLRDAEGFNTNAFGEIIVPYNGTLNYDFRLPQHELVEQVYLPQSKLVIMGVRAYNPRLGRFMQRDWVRQDPRGNLYTFAYNSPTNFTDSSGMTPEAAFDGLNPDIANLDPMDFVIQPTQPELPTVVNVRQAQARENYRILDLAYTAEYVMNDVATAIPKSACDIFLRSANPIPARIQAQLGENRQALLNLFDPERGWLPENNPETGQTSSVFTQLQTVDALLARSLQTSTTLQSCQSTMTLPQIPMPNVTGFYHNLQAMRALLDEVPLYPLDLDFAPMVDGVAPEINEVIIQPSVVPELSGQITDIQSQTSDFFSNLLLPELTEPMFTWQNLYQAQSVAPATWVNVDN